MGGKCFGKVLRYSLVGALAELCSSGEITHSTIASLQALTEENKSCTSNLNSCSAYHLSASFAILISMESLFASCPFTDHDHKSLSSVPCCET